jgi:hypothetical protein
MDKDIYNNLMKVANLFGGYATNDEEAVEYADKPEGFKAWLEGRACGYRLVESHCKRMAAMYKEEEK